METVIAQAFTVPSNAMIDMSFSQLNASRNISEILIFLAFAQQLIVLAQTELVRSWNKLYFLKSPTICG
uniref:Uncharacterized protein n=1 Tax=Kalanchoe fedtschenkoi TaxID=63787 RepID=A0A7N1A8U1_KALFE